MTGAAVRRRTCYAILRERDPTIVKPVTPAASANASVTVLMSANKACPPRLNQLST